MLSLNELRYRDSIIIRLAAENDIRNGEKPVDIVKYLSTKKITLTESLGNRFIESPMVLLEGDREKLGIEDYFINPPDQGDPLPLTLYLPKWAGFARLLLSSTVAQEMRQVDYAFMLLQRAVDHFRKSYGVLNARKFVQDLHDTRWSIGSEMTAGLLTIATQKNSITKSDLQLGKDHRFLMSEISALRKKLTLVKNTCSSLDEWSEGLYSINPRIWAMLSYLRESDLPESDKWYRYFAEIDADITPCLMRNVFSVIQSEKGESLPSWESLFISEREKSSDKKEFKQRLQFLLYTRTSIPKYWYDLALKSYETTRGKFPDSLGSIDKWKAVSIDILSSSSMEWSSNFHKYNRT